MRHIYQHIKKALILSLLMLFSISFYAQDAKTTFAPYWYLHGNLRVGATQSDLSADNLWDNRNFGGGLGIGHQFSPILGLNAKASYFFAKGESEEFAQHFKNWSMEFTINGTVNLSNLVFGYEERTVSFVSHLGFGQVQYQSKLFNGAGDSGINAIRYIGYDDKVGAVDGPGFGGRKVAFIIPVGAGMDIKLTEDLDLNLDVTTQWLDTDLFDARPTGDYNDWYTYASAGITYKVSLGGGLKKMLKNYELVKITATPEVLEEKGDMVDLEITGTIPPKYFSKKAAILMQPILVYEGGQTPLNTFTLKGEDVVGEGELINYQSGGTFKHKDTFKYTPEMNKSELIVVPLAYIAKSGTMASKEEIMNSGKYAEFGGRKLADGVIYTSERIMNKLAKIGAKHGYEKEVVVTEKANLYFAKNLYRIDENLKLNKSECAQKAMKNLKDFMLRGWKIKSIDIAGWASPEGEETFNENLSENRAKATHKKGLKNLKKMLEKAENLGFENVDDVKFNVTFHGQDWNGFNEGLKKSDMADKNSILNVVNRARTALQKEQEIRNMIELYPDLEKILAPLRRAEISVNAYEPKKTDEDILALATSDPKALDIKELLYAAHLAKCEDKLAIYKTIMKHYPKCWKSKNNAALILMKKGKLDKAEALLKEAHDMYPKEALIINNLGVLYCYKGEYDKGEKYFLKAQGLGANVDYNLGVVEIDKGNYDKALKLFGNKTCDYNVALAQVLTGKYAKAENNLKCAKGCKGSIAYLMAVIGARTNNASMVYENLIKAIKVDEGYKKVAKEDREFLKFEDTPDFKAIVE